jgi:hypothetical protein
MHNHSFRASFNYQRSDGEYQYTIDIPTVSGYVSLAPVANLTNTLLLSYLFPLAYPDWQIGSLAYVRRFSGSFFSDFENVGQAQPFIPRTYGITVSADVNLLRFSPVIGLGGKLIFITQNPLRDPIIQFLFNVNY